LVRALLRIKPEFITLKGRYEYSYRPFFLALLNELLN